MEKVTVSTLAGTGAPGFADGPNLRAQFNFPCSITVGKSGELFICDRGNCAIRLIEAGSVSIYAGTGAKGTYDGPLNQAMFGTPVDACLGTDGTLFVADSDPARGRAIKDEYAIETIVGGAPTKKREKVDLSKTLSTKVLDASTNLGSLTSCAVGSNNEPFFAHNNYIFRLSGGKMHREHSAAGLGIRKIATDPSGTLYWTEAGTNRIKSKKGNKLLTIVGKYNESKMRDGPAAKSRVCEPHAIAVAPDGTVFFSELKSHSIKMLHRGNVSTIAGNGAAGSADGQASQCSFNRPEGLALDLKKGVLYIADTNNHCIRMLNLDGVVDLASLRTAAVVPESDVPVPSSRSAPTLRGVSAMPRPDLFAVFTVAGSGAAGEDDGEALKASFRGPKSVAIGSKGEIYVADDSHKIRRIFQGAVQTIVGATPDGSLEGSAEKIAIGNIVQLAVDKDVLYFADAGNGLIRKLEGGIVSIVAGGGKEKVSESKGRDAKDLRLDGLQGISVGPLRKIYVSYTSKGMGIIAKIDQQDIATRYVSQTEIPAPSQLCATAEDELYIPNRTKPGGIRKVKNGKVFDLVRLAEIFSESLDGDVTKAARTYAPIGIAAGPDGSVYFTEGGRHQIRVLRGGQLMTFAGSPNKGRKDGVPGLAGFNGPTGIALDHARAVLYVADRGNNLIRAITLPSDIVMTAAQRRASVHLGTMSSSSPSLHVGGGFSSVPTASAPTSATASSSSSSLQSPAPAPAVTVEKSSDSESSSSEENPVAEPEIKEVEASDGKVSGVFVGASVFLPSDTTS